MPPGVNQGNCHDATARKEVAEVRHELRNHIAVYEIKHENLKTDVKGKHDTLKSELTGEHASLTKALDEIKSLMKWAGSLIITLIIGVLGWSLVQQYQANEQQKRELEQQIRLLQEQERTRVIAEQNRDRLNEAAQSGQSTGSQRPAQGMR